MLQRILNKSSAWMSLKNTGLGSRRAHRPSRRSPRVELLEERRLLSFGSEQLISTQVIANDLPDNASSSNGTSVVVWRNTKNGPDHDIYAQRFDVSGKPSGGPIQVDHTKADSDSPHVAIDPGGQFIVTWVDHVAAKSYVFMREFKSDGTPLTGKTKVTTSGADDAPDVAASAKSLVITFVHHKMNDTDIRAERFTYSKGLPVGQGIFTVAGATAKNEFAPSVAMAPSGAFDIAYEHFEPSTFGDIWMDRYDGKGKFIDLKKVNTDAQVETLPSVAVDNAGNAVVAYEVLINQGDIPLADIWANRVGHDGTVIKPDIFVQHQGWSPSVALEPAGGPFAVASISNPYVQFQVTEISGSNTPMANNGPYSGSYPAISVDGSGRLLATYQHENAAFGPDEVFSRRAPTW
jgi:hypothetical protein